MEIGDVVTIVDIGAKYSFYISWLEVNKLDRKKWNINLDPSDTFKIIHKARHLSLDMDIYYIESIRNGCRVIIDERGMKLFQNIRLGDYVKIINPLYTLNYFDDIDEKSLNNVYGWMEKTTIEKNKENVIRFDSDHIFQVIHKNYNGNPKIYCIRSTRNEKTVVVVSLDGLKKVDNSKNYHPIVNGLFEDFNFDI